jgi:cold shock CspA family protein
VVSENLREVDLSGCRKISASGMENILRIAETCSGLREVNITTYSNEAILRAVAAHARDVCDADSALDFYRKLPQELKELQLKELHPTARRDQRLDDVDAAEAAVDSEESKSIHPQAHQRGDVAQQLRGDVTQQQKEVAIDMSPQTSSLEPRPDGRLTGVICNTSKLKTDGYGFIKPDTGTRNVFFNIRGKGNRNVIRLSEGQAVKYTQGVSPKGACAENIKVLQLEELHDPTTRRDQSFALELRPDSRLAGVIYNTSKLKTDGYGFIKPENGGRNIFFNIRGKGNKNVTGLAEGQVVKYTQGVSLKGACAENVMPMKTSKTDETPPTSPNQAWRCHRDCTCGPDNLVRYPMSNLHSLLKSTHPLLV